MARPVRRDHTSQQCFSLRQVARSFLCCLIATGAFFCSGVSADPGDLIPGRVSSDRADNSGDSQDVETFGVPIFRVDDTRWFDVTIDLPDHPETAREVEEQRNRDAQMRKSGRPETSTILPDTNEITEGIRLRFHYRFD